MSDVSDPKYRPYRGLAWGLYLVLAVGFSSLIIFSVFKSVLQMTPAAVASGPALNEAECLAEARVLFGELETQRKELGQLGGAALADQRFLTFRLDWLKRKRALEPRCLQPRSKSALALLDRLLDLYTTGSVQFAGAVGPTIDQLAGVLGAGAP